MTLRVLDLFSGIGGFSLGLERAGMRTVAFCEIDPFARRVLAKHWPEVPCYDDVRTLTAGRLAEDGVGVDLVCGGFPCQDVSFAGRGAGLAGERSGLWAEIARLVGELRPRYVIVENVAALLGRGLDQVLGDLAALGYDAEWHAIPACAVGAPHARDRVWIVAYPCRKQHEGRGDADGWPPTEIVSRSHLADAHGAWEQQPEGHVGEVWGRSGRRGWWTAEPALDRVVHGVPDRVDRLRGLGNAVVPMIPELIGRAILDAIRRHETTLSAKSQKTLAA